MISPPIDLSWIVCPDCGAPVKPTRGQTIVICGVCLKKITVSKKDMEALCPSDKKERKEMSRRNSIKIDARRVSVEPSSIVEGEVTITVSEPSEADLIRLISEASSLLKWRKIKEKEV